jgi:hypothetical protein
MVIRADAPNMSLSPPMNGASGFCLYGAHERPFPERTSAAAESRHYQHRTVCSLAMK